MVQSKLKPFLLILICMFGMLGCSKETTAQEIYVIPATKMDAMMEITNAYVTEQLGLTDAAVVFGNPLSVFRLTAGKLEPISYEKYPVFADNQIVAFTTCIRSETGEYLPGCGASFAEAFWQVYSEQTDTPIAIVYAKEGAYLVRKGENPILLHKMPVEGCDAIQGLDRCRDSLVYASIS